MTNDQLLMTNGPKVSEAYACESLDISHSSFWRSLERRQSFTGGRQRDDAFAHELVIGELQPQPLRCHRLALRIRFQHRLRGPAISIRVVVVVSERGDERCDDRFARRIRVEIFLEPRMPEENEPIA